MPKPIAEWDEDDVLSLPAAENDTFERKGTKLLDLTVPGVHEDDVLNELAKQLSAFANMGGGRIIYGIADDGSVDSGGVARCVKGRQSTKEWLEDVVPTLTDFEVLGFNVYEILPKAAQSHIAPDKSFFVVDVPDSDRAPHQSKRDLKYYVRLAGKSQPASHRMIEDIRNRRKHPLLALTAMKLNVQSLPPFDPSFARFAGNTMIRFKVQVNNSGRLMAQNVCLHLALSVPIHWENYDKETLCPRGTEAFWELRGPVYPGMEIGFWIQASIGLEVPPPNALAPFGGSWLVGGSPPADVRLQWRLFADHAPMREGGFTLEELGFAVSAGRLLDDHSYGRKIRQIFQQL